MAALTVAEANQYIAIYVRISVDKAGREEGVGRQEKWGRAYVKRMVETSQWPDLPIRVFKDNDVSAFDDHAHRPGYEALRDAIRNGEVAYLWTVEQTRLEANKTRWPTLVLDLEMAGIEYLHTNRDGTVRLDEVADIKNILAWHERKRTRKRLHETLTDLADEGRPHGGSVFGYDHGRNPVGQATLVIHEQEAAAVRFMAKAIDLGWSQAEICRALNTITLIMMMCGHRGVPPKFAGRRRKDGTVVSSAWVPTKVKNALRAPTVAALRVYQGKVHRQAIWEPILDEVTWRRICARLESPRRVIRPDGKAMTIGQRPKPARKFMLTGYMVCGRESCGHTLTGRMQGGKKGARPIYFCHPSTKNGGGNVVRGGCARLAVNAEPVEQDFERRFLAWVDTDEFRQQFAVDHHEQRREELDCELARIEQQHAALAMRWGKGKLPDAAWDAARAELDDRKARAYGELAALPAPAGDLDPDAIVTGWAEMSINEKRQVISLFVSGIVVRPATPGASRYDPGRVTVYDIDGNEIPAVA